LAPTKSEPQDTVTLAMLLQVMVCMLPVDTIFVLHTKVLLSGHGQKTVVAEPMVEAFPGVMLGLTLRNSGPQLLRHPPMGLGMSRLFTPGTAYSIERGEYVRKVEGVRMGWIERRLYCIGVV